MEVQLQDLISKIKKDGISTAEKEAAKIISDAKAQADKLVQDANSKIKDMMDKVKKEEESSVIRGREAMANAGRDLILNVNTKLMSLFDDVLQKSVQSAISKDTLISLIKKSINDLKIDGDIVLELSEKDSRELADAIKSELASVAIKGLEIKPTKSLTSGFKISSNGSALAYDLSSEAIAQQLGEYVNNKLAEDLKKSAKL